MSDWAWVLIAWAQLVVAYVGYLLYLNWRAKKLQDEE
jgi:hypothetical protein